MSLHTYMYFKDLYPRHKVIMLECELTTYNVFVLFKLSFQSINLKQTIKWIKLPSKWIPSANNDFLMNDLYNNLIGTKIIISLSYDSWIQSDVTKMFFWPTNKAVYRSSIYEKENEREGLNVLITGHKS